MCIIWHTRVLCLNVFPVKKPNNNRSVDPTFFFKWPQQSLMFILSKQMLEIMAVFHSPLSANTCISTTCCTIMCKHQYKANTTRFSLFSWDDPSCSHFLSCQYKFFFEKIEDEDIYLMRQGCPFSPPIKYAMVPQHGPFSLPTIFEGLSLHKMAFPTPMVQPSDDRQGPSPFHGNCLGSCVKWPLDWWWWSPRAMHLYLHCLWLSVTQ